ncbi:hypothetical protein F5144DRAFT_311333 [Chaetomium tenue]|uniref:Uncharacterized protein n=1 Tax=Chaetomium tenue TaxID=1854479 RepID=A0ACB7P3P1_9PEZI|nr:hypothetical protein F5144DRAFT_311333 [Chaetomium globosum]
MFRVGWPGFLSGRLETKDGDACLPSAAHQTPTSVPAVVPPRPRRGLYIYSLRWCVGQRRMQQGVSRMQHIQEQEKSLQTIGPLCRCGRDSLPSNAHNMRFNPYPGVTNHTGDAGDGVKVGQRVASLLCLESDDEPNTGVGGRLARGRAHRSARVLMCHGISDSAVPLLDWHGRCDGGACMIGASHCPGVIGQSALRCLLDRLWLTLAGYHHGKKSYLGTCTYTPKHPWFCCREGRLLETQAPAMCPMLQATQNSCSEAQRQVTFRTARVHRAVGAPETGGLASIRPMPGPCKSP